MALALKHYPPSVENVPRNLTTPTREYRLWVVVVLVSLLVFLAFYLMLVAATGYLLYLAVIYPIERFNQATLLLKFGAVACAGMLFLFVLKGLFKRQHSDRSHYLEITEAQHPDLYAFIRQLCRETRAPFPKRIYLSPEVNASVFYDTSLLNLIIPVRKNLLIGLGLVNILPLNEFKAVLAHEFGHFAQSTMALGSYVYVANRIIGEMVYGRDQWDDVLAQWRQADWRIAVFGWILSGIVWGLRGVLVGAFRAINLAESALSRQMEFHADLVSVSVCGSDAIIHALSRLELAHDCLIQSLHDLRAAGSHNLYSRDLFYHQLNAAPHVRRLQKDPNMGIPPPLPADPGKRVQVFNVEDRRTPSMYDSHPSNFDRELNAKRDYIRSGEDDTSPWVLFHDPEKVREHMTRLVYRHALRAPLSMTVSDPETVQTFIDEDRAETTYDERYHGLYDDRFIEPGEVGTLAETIRHFPWNPQRLTQVYQRLYSGELKTWLEEHQRRSEEHMLLSRLAHGDLKVKGQEFEFRGSRRSVHAIKSLLELVSRELDSDDRQFATLDQDVFLAHYQMAWSYRAGVDQELLARYLFHLGAQAILRDLSMQRARVMGVLQALSGGGQVSEDDMNEAARYFREARNALHQSLVAAGKLQLPPLKNMQAGTPLSSYLGPLALLPDVPSGTAITGDWVDNLLHQFSEVHSKVRRIHFKSLGGILAQQEQIAGAWRQAMAAGQTAPPRPVG